MCDRRTLCGNELATRRVKQEVEVGHTRHRAPADEADEGSMDGVPQGDGGTHCGRNWASEMGAERSEVVGWRLREAEETEGARREEGGGRRAN